MKYLITLMLLFSLTQLKAQNGDFEVKVISSRYANVVGQLRKVSAEGIGVEDYRNRYFVFRPHEIHRIKVRRRGLTIMESLGGGTVVGLGLAAGIIAVSDSEVPDNQAVALAAFMVATGAVGGTIAGVITQAINTKLVLRINENEAKFKVVYPQLEKYVNKVETIHLD